MDMPPDAERWKQNAQAVMAQLEDEVSRREKVEAALRGLILYEDDALSGYGDHHPLVKAFVNARGVLADRAG